MIGEGMRRPEVDGNLEPPGGVAIRIVLPDQRQESQGTAVRSLYNEVAKVWAHVSASARPWAGARKPPPKRAKRDARVGAR